MLTLGVVCLFHQVQKTPEEIEEMKKRKEEARYIIIVGICTCKGITAFVDLTSGS